MSVLGLPRLVQTLLFHGERWLGHPFPLREEKWPGLELGKETASEQSQLRGILGDEDLRPWTHCDLAGPGHLRLLFLPPRPAPQLFSAGPTGLGCPSSLGSPSRMQTRRHERLVLNPKRIPLWAPSRGNMAVHTVHPARATRPGTVTVQEALCSALAPVCERRPRPGGEDRRPVAEPRCCRGKVPAVCRELLVSWRVGVCRWEEGRSRPYGPHPQALAGRAAGLSWGSLGWGGPKTGGQGQTAFPGNPFVGPDPLLSQKQGRHSVWPLGPGEAAASPSLLLVGV